MKTKSLSDIDYWKLLIRGEWEVIKQNQFIN